MRKYVVSKISILREIEFLKTILSQTKNDADLAQNTLSSQIITKSVACIGIKSLLSLFLKRFTLQYFFFYKYKRT